MAVLLVPAVQKIHVPAWSDEGGGDDRVSADPAGAAVHVNGMVSRFSLGQSAAEPEPPVVRDAGAAPAPIDYQDWIV